jgi:hypothetical protein
MMQGADLSSLVLGAVLGFVASVSGLWFRRNWERFDHEQTRCRQDLIDLARSCELARIAVRHTHSRERALVASQSPGDSWDALLTSHARGGETIYDVTSRVRRLTPGELRAACAGYVYLLEAFSWQTEDAPSVAQLDDAGLQVQLLVQAALERLDTRRASTFTLQGAALTCPPTPYSRPLPRKRS